ncbi:MAG: hypothetical protein ACHREM_07675 [Polyangiales bacterium]
MRGRGERGSGARGSATALAIAMALSACRKTPDPSTIDAAPAPSVSASSASVFGDRCQILGAPVLLGATAPATATGEDAPVPFGAEIGGAITDARGFVFGLHAQGVAGEITLRSVPFDGVRAAADVRLVATLPRSPNASLVRAPILSAATKRGADAPIAAAVLELVEGVRHLRAFRIEATGPRSIGDLREDDDESEVSAIVEAPAGLVGAVWDEGDATHRRGEIHFRASFTAGSAAPAPSMSAHAAPVASTKAIAASPEIVSPLESDAAAPTIVPFGDGTRAIVFWLAERPDVAGDEERAVDGGAGEPSQEEATRWLEARAIDLRTGATLGATRALTSDKGHVQTFSAALSIAGDLIFVALRDDARPSDGDGGSIHALAIPLTADGTLGEPARTGVAADDVAPGMPRLILRTTGAFVSYLDAQDRGWLAPVFGGGSSKAAPELALARRSVIASAGDRVLVARVAGAAVEIALVKCRE